ncbi:hypothetical protein [Clostridium thermarum]|uniref:hypothetical protein n=1 Tax=Clostridium thermarum TaxID=1716543 RepID=UPI0013D86BC6|nr:hypothetical protein [Clostridium thermarum]
MEKLLSTLGLRKEAVLFDSKLYIVKSIAAIAAGYLIGMALPITRLDMISVLLGVMYNLEPINIIGIKSGVSQLVSSTIGAACTAVLILLLGINVYTIAISMALTLFVSLKINWRMVSPVAIFTCIYMTQYAQLNAAGEPSVWLTFRLRIAALGTGVVIAIIFNFIFSFFYYRSLAYKRLNFAKLQLINGLEYTQKQLKQSCQNRSRDYISIFSAIFNDLDLVYSNTTTMIKEARYSFRRLQIEKLETIERILQCFRDINHLAYDINFILCSHGGNPEEDEKASIILEQYVKVLKSLEIENSDIPKETVSIEEPEDKDEGDVNKRIWINLSSIKKYIEMVRQEIMKL